MNFFILELLSINGINENENLILNPMSSGVPVRQDVFSMVSEDRVQSPPVSRPSVVHRQLHYVLAAELFKELAVKEFLCLVNASKDHLKWKKNIKKTSKKYLKISKNTKKEISESKTNLFTSSFNFQYIRYRA